MKKYKVRLSWHQTARGYDDVVVEAPDEEAAKDWARDLIDWNNPVKIIDNDVFFDSIEEVA